MMKMPVHTAAATIGAYRVLDCNSSVSWIISRSYYVVIAVFFPLSCISGSHRGKPSTANGVAWCSEAQDSQITHDVSWKYWAHSMCGDTTVSLVSNCDGPFTRP